MILDYSHLLPEAITGPGDYIITYGPEPDMVFTANVFEADGGLEVQFKFGIVPGLLLDDLFVAATAVIHRVDRLAGRRTRSGFGPSPIFAGALTGNGPREGGGATDNDVQGVAV